MTNERKATAGQTRGRNGMLWRKREWVAKTPLYSDLREALAERAENQSGQPAHQPPRLYPPPGHMRHSGRDALGREEDSSERSDGYSEPRATSRRLWVKAGACDHPALSQLLGGATRPSPGGFHRLLGFPVGQVFLYFPIRLRRFTLSYLV